MNAHTHALTVFGQCAILHSGSQATFLSSVTVWVFTETKFGTRNNKSPHEGSLFLEGQIWISIGSSSFQVDTVAGH